MLTLSNLSKSFGDRVLFEDASLQVNRGDRLGLVGANGAGKSTLFSLILGEDTPDEGAVSLERRATLGFLPQETAPVGDETVLEVATAISPEVVELKKRLLSFEAGHEADSADFHEVMGRYEALGGYQLEPRAKTILRGLAFRERDFDRPARAMSGGWVMRAYIARLLVQQPDLLMLDEPTNHLDLMTREALSLALNGFDGTLMLVSHDRALLRAVCEEFWLVGQGTVRSFDGDLDDYQRYLLDLAQQRREAAAATRQTESGGATAEADGHAMAAGAAAKPLSGGALRKQQQAQRQQYLNQRRPLQKQLDQIEADMAALGAEKTALEERLCQPMPAEDIAAAGKQLKTVQQQLDEAEERWLQVSASLEELDQSAGQG